MRSRTKLPTPWATAVWRVRPMAPQSPVPLTEGLAWAVLQVTWSRTRPSVQPKTKPDMIKDKATDAAKDAVDGH